MTAHDTRPDGGQLVPSASAMRHVLGHFCTGVAVITGHDGQSPHGFTCQSITSVSLEPPYISFCPANTSSSWPVIRQTGAVCVNILAADQLSQHPGWYENLPGAALLETFANAPVPPNPLDAAPDPQSRTLLALALQHHEDPAEVSSRDQPQTMTERVENALHALESRSLERRQREIRSLIAEADRRGDQTILAQLTAEKLQIDRALRQR